MKVRYKFTIIFSILIAAIVLIIGIGIFSTVSNLSSTIKDIVTKQIVEISKENMKKSTQGYASSVEGMFKTAREQVTKITRDVNIIDALYENKYEERLNNILIQEMQRSQIIENIYVIDTQGLVVGGTSKTLVGQSLENDESYKRSLKGEVVVGSASGTSVDILMPLRNASGKTVGVLCEKVKLSYFSDYIQTIAVGQKGYALLTDLNKNVLYHNDKSKVGKNTDDKLILEGIDKIVKGQAKEGYVGESGARDKDPKIVSCVLITNTNWVLVTNVSKSEFMSQGSSVSNDISNSTKNSYYAIFVIAVALIIAGAVVIYILTKRLTSPLEKLLKLMSRAENGDFTVVSKFKSNDEIGMLSKTFNKMIDGQRILINGVTSGVRQMDTGIQDVTSSISKLAVSVGDVSQAINEMGNSIQENAANVEQAATATGFVSSSIEQMGESIKVISEHSKEVQLESQKTIDRAQEGKQIVNETVAEMDQISQSSVQLSNAMIKLSSSTEQVGQIVNLIADIAKQTNLLALNAAIEAARAGDAGRGFAVVADEIRTLAEKSATSTKEISKLISGIESEVKNAVNITGNTINKVNEGVENVRNTGKSFELIYNAIENTVALIQDIASSIEQQEISSVEIIKNVEKMNDLINHISATSEEQASGTEEVVRFITGINEATQAISASTEEQAASSEEVIKLFERFKTE